MGITPEVKGLTERIIFVDGAGCRLHIRESLVGSGLYVLATNWVIDKKIELCAIDASEKDLPVIAERIKNFVREIRRRRFD